MKPNRKKPAASVPVRCPACCEVKCYVAAVKGLEPREYALRPCGRCARFLTPNQQSKLEAAARVWLAPLPPADKETA